MHKHVSVYTNKGSANTKRQYFHKLNDVIFIDSKIIHLNELMQIRRWLTKY